MKPVRQHLLTYILLLILCLPALVWTGLRVQQHAVKVGMKERLESERLDTVYTHAGSLHWINEGEVHLPKGLFDVKEKLDQVNGQVILIGLYDLEETEIEEELEALFRKKQKDQPGQSQFWSKVITSDLFSFTGLAGLQHPVPLPATKLAGTIPSFFRSPQLAGFTPPPEWIS